MLKPKKNLAGVVRFSKSEKSRLGKIRLDLNEFVGTIPSSAIAEMLSGINSDFLSTYPEYTELYKKLSIHLGLPQDHFLLTNGSDSASKLIFDTFISPRDRVLATSPTFAMHKVYGNIAEASMEVIFYDFHDFSFPLEDCLAQITTDLRMLILVNPVNPLGTFLSEADLVKVMKKTAKTGTIFFLDEAYVEFTGKGMANYVMEYENLIVTRTFSKAYGLSGVRLGYVIACPNIVRLLGLTQPTFDVNSFAVHVAEYFLDHPKILEDSLRQVAEGRYLLSSELQKLGFMCHISDANFILIDVGDKAKWIGTELKKKNILISSDLGIPALEKYIRVTVGSKDKMLKFLRAFQEILTEAQ